MKELTREQLIDELCKLRQVHNCLLLSAESVLAAEQELAMESASGWGGAFLDTSNIAWQSLRMAVMDAKAVRK